jgi:3-methyl-2-oxobutanoate hydroxymethyltransferase
MPYGSYATAETAVINAVRLMKESGADAVKLQGGRDMFGIIKAVADAGVPVMSHVGLLPHRVHLLGGFRTQGRSAEEALEIIDNSRAIEAAGAVGLEIEAVPH